MKLNFLVFVLEVYTILILLFEVALPGADIINETPKRKLAVSFLPLLITILSKYIEGWSFVTFPALICSTTIPIGTIMEGIPKLGFGVLVSMLAIAHLKSLRSYPIKGLLEPTGPLRVGSKLFKEKGHPIFSVYYPTTSPTTKFPKFIPDNDAHKKYREIAQGNTNFPPGWLLDIMTHFCTKLNIKASVDAPLVTEEKLKTSTNHTKFVPLIFSHGLGASRNHYSSLLCQLASQGYFIISMDHQDNVKEMFSAFEKYTTKYLDMRVKEVLQTIEDLCSETGLIRSMFGEQIEFDMSRLTVMGHSFGGATAYRAASEDSRVKNCVLLDPWLAAIPKETLDGRLNCNLLMLESWDWNERTPESEITKNNLRVMEAQRDNEFGALYCKVPNSQHNHFSDDVLVVGGVLKALKLINDIESSIEVHKSCIQMLDNYCATVVARKQTSDYFMLYQSDEKFPLVKYAQK